MPAIREHFVSLPRSGITTRVLEAGSGPPALLLHGNPDDAQEWTGVMTELSATHRCIAPDIPGYGKSPEPPASFDYSCAAQIAFVDELLGALGVSDPVLLIVHDIGGVMGIAWAGAHTDRLRAMLITNTVAFENFEWFSIAKTWGRTSPGGRFRATLGMAAIGLRKGALFKKIFWAANPQLSEEQVDRVVRSFACNRAAKRASLRQFREMTQASFFTGFAALLSRITAAVPVLVLWGDRDPYVATEYAQRFGQAQVIVLPDAGHWVALTEPARLVSEARAIEARGAQPIP